MLVRGVLLEGTVMNCGFYVGVYWGDRREGLDACAGRLSEYLAQLRECDVIFRQWFELGYSRKQALEKPVEIEISYLRGLLDQGRHRTDIGQHPIEDLGFHVSIWNGLSDSDGSTVFSTSCGSFSEHPGILNSCVLTLPDNGENADRVLNYNTLQRILSVAVRAWEPDWGVVTSYSLSSRHPAKPRAPYWGWILYLSEHRGKVPSLAPPASTLFIEEKGTIITVTDEHFDCKWSDHLNSMKRVYSVLGKAGLLKPIP